MALNTKTELDELKEKIAKSTSLSEIAELGLQLATLAEKQEQEAKNSQKLKSSQKWLIMVWMQFWI